VFVSLLISAAPVRVPDSVISKQQLEHWYLYLSVQEHLQLCLPESPYQQVLIQLWLEDVLTGLAAVQVATVTFAAFLVLEEPAWAIPTQVDPTSLRYRRRRW
jgi:hypothetical protein